jgi:hypothetical protein
MAHSLYVLASFGLFLAMIACGISFFAPFWLGNVTHQWPSTGANNLELNPGEYYNLYITVPGYSDWPIWRGLWAQCSGQCQWFWQYDYKLQKKKFTALRKSIP